MDKDEIVEDSESGDDNIEKTLYRLKIDYSGETELCEIDSSIELKNNDHVVIDTRYGRDLVHVLGPLNCNGCCSKKDPFSFPAHMRKKFLCFICLVNYR